MTDHTNGELRSTAGKSPAVTLIVPVYNAGKYLEECLRSIISQNIDDFEVIVVDDGSTDNSIEITKRICEEDSRFRLVVSPHRGVSAARNTGIDMAMGKYIGFVDADDCLLPYSLSILVDTARVTGAEVCIGGYYTGITYSPVTQQPFDVLVYTYSEVMRRALYQQIIINSPWGMIIERNLLGDDCRFREGIRYEDLDAFYRFYESARKIAVIPVPVYFYRQPTESFMHRWSDSRLDVLDVTDRLVNYMQERHPELAEAARDRRFSAHFNMLALLYRHGIDNRAAIDRCLAVIREQRGNALRDSEVRLKNKLGAIASYGGKGLIKFLSHLLY